MTFGIDERTTDQGQPRPEDVTFVESDAPDASLARFWFEMSSAEN